MSFWRDEVIGFALSAETRRQMEEQAAWIAREPENAAPYFNLARLCRMEGKTDAAFGLLLEAVRLDAGHVGANVALAEMYIVAGDYAAAWRHARVAAQHGDRSAVELLERYGVME